jgi:WD40 repeat protein
MAGVNALSISRGIGEFLISGGDDTRILLWTLFASIIKPIGVFTGHQSNIFSCAFDASQDHVLSTGNDGLLLRYDLSRGNDKSSTNACNVFLAHDDAVPKVSTSPDNSNLALTAGHDCIFFVIASLSKTVGYACI